MTAPAPRERLPHLDAVRGLAAAAVVAFHFGGFFAFAGSSGEVGERVRAVTGHGWLGVQVFFVLSGFVIAMTAPPAAAGAGAAGRFLARRLVRLTPPYWASVVLVVGLWLVAVAAGRGERGVTPSAGSVAAHLAYAQAAFGYPGLQDVYWTLALEVQFYALFAVALAAGAVRPFFGRAVFAGLTAAALVAAFSEYDTNDWFVGHWHGFALGALACAAARPGRAALAAFLAAAAGVAAVAVVRARPHEAVLLATAMFLVMAGRRGGVARWLSGRWLTGLGRISYSLYITHAVVGAFVFARLRPALGTSDAGVCVIVAAAVAASLVVAAAGYRWVERPATRLSHRVRVT